MAHKISENRQRLKEILSRYSVAKAEDIKEKIKKGELVAHPAFEDYLSALAYRIGIDETIARLEGRLKESR